MLRKVLSFILAFAAPHIVFSQQPPQTSPSGYSSVRTVGSDEKIYTVDFELTHVPNPHSGPIASFPRVERDGQGDWYICRELSRNIEVRGAGSVARFYDETFPTCPPGKLVCIGSGCPASTCPGNVAPNPDNYQVRYGYESWDDPVFGVATTIKARLEITMAKDPVKAKCPVFEQEFRKEYVFGASKFWYRADGYISSDAGRKFDFLWIHSHSQMPQSYCTNKLVLKGRGGNYSFNVSDWKDTGPVIRYEAVGRGTEGGSNIGLNLYVRFAPTYDDKVLEADVRRQLGCTAAPTEKWGFPPAFIKHRTLAPDTIQFYYEKN